jgi:PPE-repeat protein
MDRVRNGVPTVTHLWLQPSSTDKHIDISFAYQDRNAAEAFGTPFAMTAHPSGSRARRHRLDRIHVLRPGFETPD